jgi:iron(III) transport system permease protein
LTVVSHAGTSDSTSEIGWAGILVLGGAICAALYLISAPLGMLLTAAFRGPQDMLPFEAGARWTIENFGAIYRDSRLYSTTLPNTLVFTFGSVAMTSIIAFTLAWLVERTDLPLRNTVFTLMLFPLLVPGVILTIAWIFLFAPNTGVMNVALRHVFGLTGESGPLNIFTMGGMIMSLTIGLVPFVFLLLTATLRSMNPSLEEASEMSGAPRFTTFLRVTLPVLLPGIIAPLILATLVTLEQFETPLVLGLPARISIFSTRVYFELNPDTDLPAYGRAAAVALPFLLCGIILLMGYNRAIRRADAFVTVTGKGYRPSRIPLGRWKTPAIVFVTLYILFAAVLPALVLLWTSLYGYRDPTFATLPQISFAGYSTLFTDPKFWLAVRNTFIVAGLSATIITLIGALLSWVILRSKLPGRSALDFVSFLSLGIPSVIAGLATMLLYLSVPIGVYGTVWVLVLAYSYRLAVSTRLSRAALMQIHPELEEASAAAGGQWIATLRSVVLPLLTPSLVASFVLLFIIGFREFTLPTLLQSPDNVVLSVIMWQLFTGNQVAKAAAVGTSIVILIIPVIFIMRRLLLRDGRA